MPMQSSVALCVVGDCVLIFIRGYVKYDTKISEVWPDFGKLGKGNITLRQLMAHRAGLAAMPKVCGF